MIASVVRGMCAIWKQELRRENNLRSMGSKYFRDPINQRG